MAVLILLSLVVLLAALAAPLGSKDAGAKRRKVRPQCRNESNADRADADVDLESGVAFEPQKMSKNQKRKARLLRTPRIPFFNMARHDDSELNEDIEDDAFSLDDEAWTMAQSKMHFIGDCSPQSCSSARDHGISQDAFDLNDDV